MVPQATTTHQDPREISNAHMLRAMSNPTRLRILGLLRVEGAKTVGEISAATGVAPGSVSYHISELAAAGLVEKVETPDADRRKSWWQARDAATRPSSPVKPADAEQSEAGDLFRRMTAVTYERTYERYLDAVHGLSDDWADASMCVDQVLSLTPQELQSMNEELMQVICRWRDQHHQAQEHDDEREHVAVIMQAFKWVP